VKRRYFEPFVAYTFEVDFESVRAKIYEKLHISYDGPVDDPSRLEPEQHLESIRALTEAQSSIIVIGP
jgi:hypothetical protein